jgi:hypothetical protein
MSGRGWHLDSGGRSGLSECGLHAPTDADWSVESLSYNIHQESVVQFTVLVASIC